MLTLALAELIKVRPCKPMLVSAISTVTEFIPAVIDVKSPRLPGNTSVTVIDGVQLPEIGVCVGKGETVGVGVEVAVGEGVGVGVGTGVTVAVGVETGVIVGVGVGVGPPIA